MPSTVLMPEPDYFPNRFRWTVEDCYRLMEAGFLNGRYELIDGEISFPGWDKSRLMD